jgi:hypothetical protein
VFGHRFESRSDRLLSRSAFYRRIALFAGLSGGMIGVSLLLGTVGYHHFGDHLGWIDALLNASMILTGMGPVDRMPTDGGKLFASAYALFSGIVFLTSVATLISPIVHRALHRFHIESEDES